MGGRRCLDGVVLCCGHGWNFLMIILALKCATGLALVSDIVCVCMHACMGCASMEYFWRMGSRHYSDVCGFGPFAAV
jgi:hypothetical protein